MAEQRVIIVGGYMIIGDEVENDDFSYSLRDVKVFAGKDLVVAASEAYIKASLVGVHFAGDITLHLEPFGEGEPS